MNYREFTERVYNYKHGLTNSAESQNIQHSAKQTEEINETEQHNAEQNDEENGEDHIAHSEKGGSWDQHKYIRKEYLGNGNWRYIYEDGSSNVTNASNEKEADVKEGAYQSNKAYGNGAQNTNYQTNEAKMTSSNTGFTQARKDMYKELGEKAADHNKQLENLQGVVKGLEKSNADQAESARQVEKEALAAKAQARSDRYNKMANLDVNTSPAPYQQLTNQSVKATNDLNNKTNNLAAYNLLLEYSNGLKEVYDALKAKGYDDEEIDDFINEVESSFEYPKGMYNQIKNFDNNGYINFMDGAEAGIRDAINDVIPAVKNEAEGYRGKKVDNFMKGIDDAYIRTFDAGVQAINNGEIKPNSNAVSGITEKQENSWNNTSSKERGSIIQGIIENSGYMSEAPDAVKAQLYFGSSYAKGFAVGNISNSKPEYKEYLNDPSKIEEIYLNDPEVRDMADKMLADMVEMWPATRDFVKRKLFLGSNNGNASTQTPSNTIEGTINNDGTLNFPSYSKESNIPASSTFNPSYDWGDKVDFEQVQNDVIADSKIPGITLQDLKNKYNRWSEEYIRELVFNTTGKTLK